MRVLVTGGAGFIGSHLCRQLLGEDHHVMCLDNFSTGSESNIDILKKYNKFSFLKGDVVDPFFLNITNVDWIYHLACPASPIVYQRDPVRTLMTAVIGTNNALMCARENKARILLASTSEVYGDPEVVPQSESYCGRVTTIGPRACYDEGKRSAETLCADYHRCYGVDIRIARIFNTYGPKMDPYDGRVVSEFVVRALKNSPLIVHGDGSQTRSFCYVDDLVDGLIRLMEYQELDAIEPVNLGRPEETTISELANLVINAVGKGRVIHSKRPEDDPNRRKPDISRAILRLGWAPKIKLQNGIARTVSWFSASHVLSIGETHENGF